MLVLVALVMVAVLLVVALVIDFGYVRVTRQDSKRTADVAAASGAQDLVVGGIARPWAGACSALAYLRANRPDLTLSVSYRTGAGGAAPASDPCTGSSTSLACVASDPSSWAWITATSGNFVADIKSGYATPDASFPEDARSYSGDNGETTQGGCDQLAVIITNRDPAFFGGIGGRQGYDTTIRSVGRVVIGTEGQGVPAFLMLERTRCDVLNDSVGGSELGIVVRRASSTEPGIIHADSSGTVACTTNTNAGGYVVFGSPLPSGQPSITAEAAGSTPGIIAIRAVGTGGRSGATYPGGISVAPTTASIVSRKPVDDKYNSVDEPTISTLHAAARTAVNGAAPAGFTSVPCNTTNGTQSATRIYVACAVNTAYNPQNMVFTSATDVIIPGGVSIGNGNGLFMPAAQRVYIGDTVSVAGGGRFAVNHNPTFESTNTDAGVAAACTNREGPTWTNTTRLVIFGGGGNGALDIGGRAALCQTTVLLAGPRNQAYSAQQITDGSYDPSCTVALPCPRWASSTPTNTAGNGFFTIQGFVQWSAPNQLSTQPATGSVGLEDLALWSEHAGLSQIKSGGVLRARGVYFQPNGDNEFRSPATATPQDAQFIARRLSLLQGTLEMKPTAGNNVQIPVLRSISLVR